jgi:GMP synthase-like glutamine amidotransferase
MLAKALGAPVVRSPVPEYGQGTVRLAATARRDPLLRGLPARLPVFQWHGEAFGIPPGGVLLAEGTACPRQAFRVGRAWGVQFHNETTPPMVERWARSGAGELRRAGVEPGRMVAAYRRRARAIGRSGERMAANFLQAAGLL